MLNLFRTRNFWCSFFAFFSIFFFLSSYTSAKQTSSISDTSAIEQRIQRIQNGLIPPVLIEGETQKSIKLVDRMEELGVPAVSIAVIHDGKIEWARGFGSLKIGGPPVTSDSLFQAGSISKPVAAMAALKLVESGEIDLDVDINQYLKSWSIPDNTFTDKEKVTLRRLLSHTAGMTVHGFPGYATDDQVPSLVQVLNGEKPANTPPIVVDTVPGTTWRYSGGGYEVMQLALQDITGKPFPELLQTLVLGPAGMTQSTFRQPLPQDLLSKAAVPYQAGKQPVPGGVHIYPEMAAAGLWTTPSDLARFAIELQETISEKSNGVLTPEMARKMATNVMNSYGLGLQLGGSESNPYFSHGGANAGFQNNFVAYHNGNGAVIMTSSNAGGVLINDILRAIAKEYDWPDFKSTIRKKITVSRDLLNQYAGVYQLAPNFDLTVTLENDQLMVEATGQGKFPVYAMSETIFFPTVVEAQIEFFKDDKGNISHLILNQYGRPMKAPRTGQPGSEGAVPKEIALSKEILNQYVGAYQLAPNLNLVVTLEGDRMMTQATGQGKIPVYAISETKFSLKVADATIEFFKDDKGAVSHLVLRQEGSETVARRTDYKEDPASVDGTWTATADGPDGNPLEVTYVLEGLGKTLIGTVNTRLGGGPFSEGKIDGNKISFLVRAGQATLETTGTVSGDVINFIQRNGNEVVQFTARRVSTATENKNPEVPALDATARKEIVTDLAAKLTSDYAIAETGAKMAASLREKLESGGYDNVTSPFVFSRLLTEDLLGVAHDKHLRVGYSNQPLPAVSNEPPPPDMIEKRNEEIRKMNGAITKLEILGGNIGYMRVNAVPMFDVSKDAVSAAFAFLENTDALILDNRSNGGGDPKTVAWYMSYLSEGEPYVVNTFHHRKGNRIEEFRTTDLGGLSYGAQKPVFVLTSPNTFSGGEEMTYDIQVFKRGVIVGEVTGGGANPTGPVPLVHNFFAIIPFGYAHNPITESNWEGTGVKPDVEVPAEKALVEAHLLAIERLQQEAIDPIPRSQLEAVAFKLELEKSSSKSGESEINQEQIAGKYASRLPIPPLTIEARNGDLFLNVPGNPESKLVSIGPNRYKIDGLPEGFFANFRTKDEKIHFLLEQPQGDVLLEKQ